MKPYRIFLPLLLFLLLSACAASGGRAPHAASGRQIEIAVIFDRGDSSNAYEAKGISDLAPFMERDLIGQLKRAGYQARLIRERSEFTPGPGRYLLIARIVKYNPGSSAARMFVGFGAGAASLDNHYELYGTSPQPLYNWDDGVGTSEHWSRLCRKLDGNTVKRLNEYFAKS